MYQSSSGGRTTTTTTCSSSSSSSNYFIISEWITVLHASSGIQSSVHQLWAGNSKVDESIWPGDLNKPHLKVTSHFKSYLVEQWEQLNIFQVLFIKLCYIMFTGTLLNKFQVLFFHAFHKLRCHCGVSSFSFTSCSFLIIFSIIYCYKYKMLIC